MEPPPGERDEFDAWYAEEHVPDRMRIPGFLSATRFWAVDGERGPSHLVIYRMQSLEVLSTPEYRRLKEAPSDRTAYMLSSMQAFTRFIGLQIQDTGEAGPAPYTYLVTFAVPDGRKRDFDDWYEQDHLPLLLGNPHWSRCRRYDVVEGEPQGVTRAAVHELADLAALESPEHEQVRSTEWRARLADEDWFSSARYAVYERYQDFRGNPR